MTTTLSAPAGADQESLEIRKTNVPDYVMKALVRARRSANYSNLNHIFHCIWLGGAEADPESFTCVGVAGDGDNGGYEMFKWKRGKFEISDAGYGCVETALLRVLASEASI